ncbi:MAG: response regulator [Chitinophagaceae bacterium]|nr:response regulator [Anaerolineae bacterium]
MNTILVIEDELANRKLLVAYLQRSGYTVDSVENANAALAYLGTNRPAMMLLDIRLPGMNGLDFTRRVRNEPDLADIPIVAVTAKGNPGDEQSILDAGCDGYIMKPINFSLLQSYLQRYLS